MFATIARTSYRCVPLDCLLPEHFAEHIEKCDRHDPGSADAIRLCASRWLANDSDPVIYTSFKTFCESRGRRLFWMSTSPTRKWRSIMCAARVVKAPREVMADLAELWAEWGHGDEPDLGYYGHDEYVYVIVAPEVCRIKIGYTTDPTQRFAGIRNVGPCPISVLAVVRGNRRDESTFHSLFAAERLKGTEWFHASSRVMQFAQLSRSHSTAEELLGAWLELDSHGGVARLTHLGPEESPSSIAEDAAE